MKTKGSKNKKGVSKIINHNGYITMFKPEHPAAGKNGYVLEHRMIAYDLGMLTDLAKEVHHKNEIKTDNRPDNFEILDKPMHTSITWKGKSRKHEWTIARREAKSKQMTGNKNWAGSNNEHPHLLTT